MNMHVSEYTCPTHIVPNTVHVVGLYLLYCSRFLSVGIAESNGDVMFSDEKWEEDTGFYTQQYGLNCCSHCLTLH